VGRFITKHIWSVDEVDQQRVALAREEITTWLDNREGGRPLTSYLNSAYEVVKVQELSYTYALCRLWKTQSGSFSRNVSTKLNTVSTSLSCI
jgi:secreted Zn-dependent insulinase-like peptidase